MEFGPAPLAGIMLIKPRIFSDPRGYFFESFNQGLFEKHGLPGSFFQDNESFSSKGTLRGLHFQNPPYEQGKLVRVVKGAVLDVAVDIRKASSSFGKYFSAVLTSENKTMMWIPPGFAHGFLALEDDTVFSYKCTGPYHRESEGGIRWNDPYLGISWGVERPLLSEKDLLLPLWKDFNSLF